MISNNGIKKIAPITILIFSVLKDLALKVSTSTIINLIKTKVIQKPITKKLVSPMNNFLILDKLIRKYAVKVPIKNRPNKK